MPGESPNSKTMVILGGAAQTLFSWLPHYKDLAKGRRLIIPEMRCQGKTELNPANATMKQLVSDFRNLMINLNIEKTNSVVISSKVSSTNTRKAGFAPFGIRIF